MLGPRGPLADHLAELGWSPERLARHLNAAHGPGTVGATTPYAWLSGRVPRGRLPHRVAELLSARLGRTVTVDDLWPKPGAANTTGMPDTVAPAAPTDLARAAAAVVRHSSLPTTPPADATGLAKLVAAWLLNPAPSAPTSGGPVPVDPGILDTMPVRAAALRDLSVAVGGGSAVPFMDHEIALTTELITQGRYDADTGLALHRALATTALYTGYAALDSEGGSGTTPTAYWTLGLHAAKAAADTSTGASIVAGLALEAGLQGHTTLALHLLRSAQVALLPLPTGAAHIVVASYEARALAATGETRAARAALDSLRELLPEADGRRADELHPLATPIHRAVSRSLLRLGHTREAIGYIEDIWGRSGMNTGGVPGAERLLVLARCRLAQREVDAAAGLVESAFASTPPMKSQLLRRHEGLLREGLRPYRTSAVASNAYELLHARLGADSADPTLEGCAI